jgi:hypothetical protein
MFLARLRSGGRLLCATCEEASGGGRVRFRPETYVASGQQCQVSG